MKQYLSAVLCALLLTGLLPVHCAARTAWVSDVLVLTVKEKPGHGSTVIRTIRSGARMEILKEEGLFYQIRLSGGLTGFVDKRYIVFDPPKSILIKRLTAEKEALEQKIARMSGDRQSEQEEQERKLALLTETVSDLETRLKERTGHAGRLEAQLAGANEKYDALAGQSGNMESILEKNRQLVRENKELTAQADQLTGRKSLWNAGLIKWFLTGFGVLMAGLIIGQNVSIKR